MWEVVPVPQPRFLQWAAAVRGYLLWVGCRKVMVCARDGMCAHVALSEGCLGYWCPEVCARTWLLPRLACFSGFLCVFVCLRVKGVCARVLLVWKVCASSGFVRVAWAPCVCSHAFEFVLWSMRACGVVHAMQPSLFACRV